MSICSGPWAWWKVIFGCKKPSPPPGVWVTVCNGYPDMPPAAARIANPYCPATHPAQYRQDAQPSVPCTSHIKPPDPPQPVYPKDNPKPDWMPRMQVAVLSLHVQLQHFTDVQLDAFAKKISLAGVDFVRIMMCWDDPAYQPTMSTVSPFKWSGGKANLDQLNLDFDANIIRLRDILKPYHVRLCFDLFDNCDAEHAPWNINVQGVNGIYDPAPLFLSYAKSWADRISNLLPAADGHKIGLGNELRFPGDNMSDDMRAWVLNVMLPLGEYLLDKGYKSVGASADTRSQTGHWLSGACSPDVSTKFGIRDFVLEIHTQGLASEFEPNFGSDVRAYAYSDDGVVVRDPEKQQPPPTSTGRYQATNAERLSLMTMWWGKYGPAGEYSQRRLDHIEFLPSICAETAAPDAILPHDLDIYNLVSTTLWGADIRRTY
jgi:hypothetical protein